jgi:hypothetical protein
MTDRQALEQALAVLIAIMKMSDRVEECGGLTCLSGIAAANTMQNSIQKNIPRLAKLAMHLHNVSSEATP